MAVYEITSVTKNDEGQFICMAQNAAGASEDRVQLIVEQLDTLPTRGDIPGKKIFLKKRKKYDIAYFLLLFC